MNERKLALSYLDLNPELRNNLGIIAEEMYRIMEPYRNQSENAVKAMQQAMKSVVLPPDYLKNLQMDFSLPLGEITREIAELSKTIDTKILTAQMNAAVQQAVQALRVAEIPNTFVSVEKAEELYQQVKPIIPEDEAAAVEQSIEVAKKHGNKISWRDIITVIGFIIGVLTFAKDLLPDKHDQFMESEIVEIRENQEKQIQLMENIYQFFDDLRDDSAEFGETFQQADDLVDSVAEDEVVNVQEDNANP